MKINKNLCRWFGNMSLPVLFSAVLLSSCGDELETDAYTGSYIRFSVSEEAEWRGTKAIGEPAEKALPRDSVQLLNGGDANTPLYLHTLYTDSIAPASDSRQDTAVLTRATPVKTETFYDSFGVLASAYDDPWDEASCLPDYMYDVEVTEASGWTTSYHWPNLTKKIKFFAYAPYHGGGIILSDKTTAGSPTITYTVPTAVADQKDLLVATMDEQTGNTHTAVALTFDHALTAVKFVCGADMQGGTVKSVSLKNVFSKGIYNYKTKSWSNVDTPVSFSQTLNKSTSGKPDEALTTDEQTFMMLPQTLPADAQIEVVFTETSGTEHTLTADIKGTDWPMGKTVIYKISSTSVNWTYTLNVVMTGAEDFPYIGGTQPYSVISYKQNTKGVKEPASWKTQFSEDDGASWQDTQPDWLTAFTATGAGGTSSQSYNATVSAQVGKDNGLDTQLRKNQSKGTKDSPYNLANPNGGSTDQNTANCYVVSASGYYSFPLVYGNAIKNGAPNTSAYTSTATGEHILTPFINHTGNPITDPYISKNAGCTPSRPELVWQDAPKLVSDIKYNDAGNGNISFYVDKNTIQQGNAVIAIKDDGDQVLWSWHIWVTDKDLSKTIEVTNHQSKKYKFMPLVLGWCDGSSKNYAERSCKVRFTAGNASKEVTIKQTPATISTGGSHTYYQWGRKDPFQPSANNGVVNKTWYDKDNKDHTDNPKQENLSTGATCINNYILKPGVMHSNSNGDNLYYNLWSANNNVTTENDDPVEKTIYDPSPVGFKLPPSNAFTGFTTSGQYESTISNINGKWDNSLKGWNFYTDSQKTTTIFFPASGYRYYSGGGLYAVGSLGYYWSAVPVYQNLGRYLYFNSSRVNPLSNGFRGCGFGVRPSQE